MTTPDLTVQRTYDEPVTLVEADWNLPLDLVRHHVATPAGARVVVGHHIDHLVAKGHVAVVRSVRNLGPLGSDHDALLWTLSIDGHRFTVLGWNVYVNHDPAHVREMLAALIGEHEVDMIALQEAYKCHAVLAGLAERFGYWHQQAPAGEAAGCALLFRKAPGRQLVGRGALRMFRRWTGPKLGNAKEPRSFPRLRIRMEWGRIIRAASAHAPTGGLDGGPNLPAVRETVRRTAKWIARR